MLNELNQSLSLIVRQTQTNLVYLAWITGLLSGTFVLNRLLHDRLLYLGIIPRKLAGLAGIVCAPLLHANFNHLFFNLIPLLVLSDFILVQGVKYYLYVTLIITLMSGFLTWCLAKPGVHVGASGLVTGYWGFLVTNSVLQPSLTSIMLGLVTVWYFAGIFFGIFPAKKGVSWEGHLFGLLAGVVSGYGMIKLE